MRFKHKEAGGHDSGTVTLLLVCLAIAGIAVYFLYFQEGGNLSLLLPILVLLACPLMHLLLHRRHTKH